MALRRHPPGATKARLHPSSPRYVVFMKGQPPSSDQKAQVRKLAGLQVISESASAFLVDGPPDLESLIDMLKGCPGWSASKEVFYGLAS